MESAETVNEMTLNELVKLTTLWTTGPWFGLSLPAYAHKITSPKDMTQENGTYVLKFILG